MSAMIATDTTVQLLPGGDVIIFDADVLIKLAQHPENLEAIDAIRAGITEGRYSVVLSAGVRNAFHREKHDAAAKVWNTYRIRIREMRQLAPFADDPQVLQQMADRLNAKMNTLQSTLPDTINAVEQLINSSAVIQDTEAELAKAATRIREHRPPAVKGASSSVQ